MSYYQIDNSPIVFVRAIPKTFVSSFYSFIFFLTNMNINHYCACPFTFDFFSDFAFIIL